MTQTQDVSKTTQNHDAPLIGLKAAVIGGGGGGIGRAISMTLGAAGADVAVVDVDLDRALDVAKELGASGGTSIGLGADMLRAEEAELTIAKAAADLGGLDVLATVIGGNRGLASWGPMHSHTAEQWDAVMSMNLRYVFLAVRAAIPIMLEQGRGGSIVSIGSISGMAGAPNHLSYGVGKAGVIHMAKSVTLEYGRHGIRMNVVSPGRVRTPATSDTLGPDETALMSERIPLNRVGTPDDIANAVLFLASPASAYISGQNLVVDGGATARFPMPLSGAHPSEAF